MSDSVRQAVGPAWRAFFLLAAAYDIGLGLAFMLGGDAILETIGMEAPPHVAYIQLAAVFVLIQGASYLFAWHDAVGNRGVIWVGVLYKAAYAGLAAWYLVLDLMPSVFFIPWAVADLLFMAGFLWFLLRTSRGQAA
jgi:hypothetical protein